MTKRNENTLPKHTIEGGISSFLDQPLTTAEIEVEGSLRSRINVAKLIAESRLWMGLTQDELGRRAGTKQSRISELESLRGNVRFDTLDRVARELGLVITLERRHGFRLYATGEPRRTEIWIGDQTDLFQPATKGDAISERQTFV